MSLPENDLNEFRSYNYHHLLYVCDSAATAESLVLQEADVKNQEGSQSGNIATEAKQNYRIQFDILNNSQSDLEIGDVTQHKISIHEGLQSLQNGDGYVMLLCNTAADARYTIQSVEFTSYLNSVDPYSIEENDIISAASIGKMQVKEHQGFRFINQIKKFGDAAGTDGTMLTYVLKTYFVGITHDGKTVTKSNYTPLIFIMADVGTIFDESGALYDFTFAIVGHGSARYNQAVSTFVNGLNINFSQNKNASANVPIKEFKGETTQIGFGGKLSIKQAISYFETHLNEEYDYIKEEYFKKNIASGKVTDIDYKIILDSEYDNEEKYIFGQNKRAVDLDEEGNKTGIISFKDCYSIEQALLRILETSTRILNDAKFEEESKDTNTTATPESATQGNTEQENTGEQKPAHTRYVPKILSTVITGRDKIEVVYNITRQEHVVDPTDEEKKKLKEGKKPAIRNEDDFIVKNAERLIKNRTIVFDYIFTGKNVDVLDFDMNMKLSTAFFHAWLTSTNDVNSSSTMVPTAGEEAKATSDDSKTKSPHHADRKTSKKFEGADAIDILWPARIPKTKKQDSSSNAEDPIAMKDFMSALQEFAGFGSMDAQIKIRGNPAFISALAVAPTELRLKDGRVALDNTNEELGETFSSTQILNASRNKTFVDIVRKPVFCLINVRMPENDNFRFGTNAQGESINKLIPFWYRGLYRIITVTNTFDNGEFTQTLQLVALPHTQEKVKELRGETPSTNNIRNDARTIEQKAQDAGIDVASIISRFEQTIQISSPNKVLREKGPVELAQDRTTALANNLAGSVQSEITGINRLAGQTTEFISKSAQQLNSAISSVNSTIGVLSRFDPNRIKSDLQSEMNSLLLAAQQPVMNAIDEVSRTSVDRITAEAYNTLQSGFDVIFGQGYNPVTTLQGFVDNVVDTSLTTTPDFRTSLSAEQLFGPNIYQDLGFIGNSVRLGMQEKALKELDYADQQTVTSLLAQRTDISSFATKKLFDTNPAYVKANIQLFENATSTAPNPQLIGRSESSVLQRLAAKITTAEHEPWSTAFSLHGIPVKPNLSVNSQIRETAANLNAFFGTKRENLFQKNSVSRFFNEISRSGDVSLLTDTSLVQDTAEDIRNSLSAEQREGFVRTIFGRNAFSRYTRKTDPFERIVREQKAGDRILSTLQVTDAGRQQASRLDLLAGSESEAGTVFDEYGGILQRSGLRSFDAFDNITTKFEKFASSVKSGIFISFGGAGEQFLTTSQAGGGILPPLEGRLLGGVSETIESFGNTLGEVTSSISRFGLGGNVFIDGSNEIDQRRLSIEAADATDPNAVSITDPKTPNAILASTTAGDTTAKNEFEGNFKTQQFDNENTSNRDNVLEGTSNEVQDRANIYNITMDQMYGIETVQTQLSLSTRQQERLYGTIAKRKYVEMTIKERLLNQAVQNSTRFRIPYIGINNAHYVREIGSQGVVTKQNDESTAIAVIRQAGLQVTGK